MGVHERGKIEEILNSADSGSFFNQDAVCINTKIKNGLQKVLRETTNKKKFQMTQRLNPYC
jgi:hypothetical protein